MIKIGIIGSRTIQDLSLISSRVRKLQEEYGDQLIIYSGGAPGVDTIAIDEAERFGIRTVVIRPVDHTIKAHYLYRNVELVTTCDKIIAFWDEKSTGTKFTIDYAIARNKPVEVIYNDENYLSETRYRRAYVQRLPKSTARLL